MNFAFQSRLGLFLEGNLRLKIDWASLYLKGNLFVSVINLVPRVFSLSNMAAAGEKTLAHSRNHVTDLSTESGNLFKMAAKIKTERIWVRGLG